MYSSFICSHAVRHNGKQLRGEGATGTQHAVSDTSGHLESTLRAQAYAHTHTKLEGCVLQCL